MSIDMLEKCSDQLHNLDNLMRRLKHTLNYNIKNTDFIN